MLYACPMAQLPRRHGRGRQANFGCIAETQQTKARSIGATVGKPKPRNVYESIYYCYNTIISRRVLAPRPSRWNARTGEGSSAPKVMRVVRGLMRASRRSADAAKIICARNARPKSTPARLQRDRRPARFGDFPAHDRGIGDLFRFNELLPLQAEEGCVRGLKCFGRTPGEAETAVVVPDGSFQQFPLQVRTTIALGRHVGHSGPSIYRLQHESELSLQLFVNT